jgi:hypothetical protein
MLIPELIYNRILGIENRFRICVYIVRSWWKKVHLKWSLFSFCFPRRQNLAVSTQWIVQMALPYLRRLVAGFQRRRSGFESGWGHVRLVVHRVVLRQVFSEYSGFPCLVLVQWTRLHSTPQKETQLCRVNCLCPLDRWGHGFESHSRRLCLCTFILLITYCFKSTYPVISVMGLVLFLLVMVLSLLITAGGTRHADHVAPSIRTSWHSLRRQAAVSRSV